MINQLNDSNPIVEDDGNMIRRFSIWTKAVTNLDPLSGEGSPEGIIEADQFRLYVDTIGTTGNVLYVKRNSDIGSDKKQGWILV